MFNPGSWDEWIDWANASQDDPCATGADRLIGHKMGNGDAKKVLGVRVPFISLRPVGSGHNSSKRETVSIPAVPLLTIPIGR